MLVLFNENHECVINNATTIRLGDMLCALLNYNMNDVKQLKTELEILLHSTDPTNPYILENSVGSYASLIKEKLVLIASYSNKMKEFPFYRYNNDVDKSFEWFYSLISDIQSQLEQVPPDELMEDAMISFDNKMLEQYYSAISTISNLIDLVYRTHERFKPIVDACLLNVSNTREEKPIIKLKKYGVHMINKQISSFVKNTRTTPFSGLGLLYELVGADDNLTLSQCFDFGTIPQYIYHEFMKMIASNLSVRRCKNCNQYFVIYSERILEYCDNIPIGESKSCSVIGPARTYEKKVKDDPILNIYTRAYKKYVAQKRTGKISSDDFKKWSKKARELRDKAHREGTSPLVFSEWMK